MKKKVFAYHQDFEKYAHKKTFSAIPNHSRLISADICVCQNHQVTMCFRYNAPSSKLYYDCKV